MVFHQLIQLFPTPVLHLLKSLPTSFPLTPLLQLLHPSSTASSPSETAFNPTITGEVQAGLAEPAWRVNIPLGIINFDSFSIVSTNTFGNFEASDIEVILKSPEEDVTADAVVNVSADKFEASYFGDKSGHSDIDVEFLGKSLVGAGVFTADFELTIYEEGAKKVKRATRVFKLSATVSTIGLYNSSSALQSSSPSTSGSGISSSASSGISSRQSFSPSVSSGVLSIIVLLLLLIHLLHHLLYHLIHH
ncbi:unnamed protein product [Ambrosiozyma monospora]|uniref:Unnamed protein product n=1 Tax=Ambrosiozyma monospora TaxID=43982 RepID=A0ACB5U0V8_AMBMO|nr:unnamed protein product [Ambrosiozyma monospora]